MTAFAENLAKMHKEHDHAGWLKKRVVEIKDKIQPDLQEAVEVLCQQINSWGSIPYLEIEARLGYFKLGDDGSLSNPFDSDVGQEWFNRIQAALEASSFQTIKTVTTDYFAGSYRMTVDEQGKRSAIQKKTMEHVNFTYENSPFDIRISFSQEIPVTIKDFNKVAKDQDPKVRKKIRTTYHTNQWKYDLTRVEYSDNSVEQASHEVEIEAKLEKIPYVDCVYMADSMLLKLKSLTNMCEAAEEPRKMIHLDKLSKRYIEISDLVAGLKKTSLRS